MAVGMAIEHRKTIFPVDDAVVRAEVNTHANDKGDGRMCPAVLVGNHSCSTKVKRQQGRSRMLRAKCERAVWQTTKKGECQKGCGKSEARIVPVKP